jgi:hypothetical protein
MEQKEIVKVYYAYINDPKDRRRTVTLAWQFIGEHHIRYAVAVNRVEVNSDRRIIESHRKSNGRRTALGRLLCCNRAHTTGQANIEYFANDKNPALKAIANDLVRARSDYLSPAQLTARGVVKRAMKQRKQSIVKTSSLNQDVLPITCNNALSC